MSGFDPLSVVHTLKSSGDATNLRFVATSQPNLGYVVGTSNTTVAGHVLLMGATQGSNVLTPKMVIRPTGMEVYGDLNIRSGALMVEGVSILSNLSSMPLPSFGILSNLYGGASNRIPVVTVSAEGLIQSVYEIELTVPSLENTGVMPGTYGASNCIPRLYVDPDGRISIACNVSMDLYAVPASSNFSAGIIGNVPGKLPVIVVDASGRFTFTSNVDLILPPTGVQAGTYGSSNSVPVFEVTATGQLTLACNIPFKPDVTGVVPGIYGASNLIPFVRVLADGRLAVACNMPIQLADVSTVVAGTVGSNDTVLSLNLSLDGRVASWTSNTVALPLMGITPGTYGTSNLVPILTVNRFGTVMQATQSNWTPPPTGVVPGIYGASNSIPVLEFNAAGQVVSATTAIPRANLQFAKDMNAFQSNLQHGDGFAYNASTQSFEYYRALQGIRDRTGQLISAVDGSIAFSLNDVYTGTNALRPSIVPFNGDVYIISNDPTLTSNGLSFIWSSNINQWLPIAPPELAYFDDRYIRREGGDAMSGTLDMAGFPLCNVGNPTAPTEAATKHFVDTHTETLFMSVSAPAAPFNGSMWMDTSSNANAILKVFVGTTETWQIIGAASETSNTSNNTIIGGCNIVPVVTFDAYGRLIDTCNLAFYLPPSGIEQFPEGPDTVDRQYLTGGFWHTCNGISYTPRITVNASGIATSASNVFINTGILVSHPKFPSSNTSTHGTLPSYASFGTSNVLTILTVNEKGLITAVNETPIEAPPTGVVPGTYGGSNLTLQITLGKDGRIQQIANCNVVLPNTTVTADLYGCNAFSYASDVDPSQRTLVVPRLTVNEDGRVSSATNVPLSLSACNLTGTYGNGPLYQALQVTIDPSGIVSIASNVDWTFPTLASLPGLYGNASNIPTFTVGPSGTLSTVQSVPLQANLLDANDVMPAIQHLQGLLWNVACNIFQPYRPILKVQNKAPDADGNIRAVVATVITIQNYSLLMTLQSIYVKTGYAAADVIIVVNDPDVLQNGRSFIWSFNDSKFLEIKPPSIEYYNTVYVSLGDSNVGQMMSNLSLGTNRVLNVADPILATDLANSRYVVSRSNIARVYTCNVAPTTTSLSGDLWIDTTSLATPVFKVYSENNVWNSVVSSGISATGASVFYGASNLIPQIQVSRQGYIVLACNVLPAGSWPSIADETQVTIGANARATAQVDVVGSLHITDTVMVGVSNATADLHNLACNAFPLEPIWRLPINTDYLLTESGGSTTYLYKWNSTNPAWSFDAVVPMKVLTSWYTGEQRQLYSGIVLPSGGSNVLRIAPPSISSNELTMRIEDVSTKVYPPCNLTDTTTLRSNIAGLSYGNGTYGITLDSLNVVALEYPPISLTKNTCTIAGARYGNGQYKASATQSDGACFDAWAAFNKTGGWSNAAWKASNLTDSKKLTLSMPTYMTLSYYTIQNGLATGGADGSVPHLATAPATWTVEGAAEGYSTWTVLDRRTNVSWTSNGNEKQTFQAATATLPYNRYRLTISSNTCGGQNVHVGEWRLFGVPVPAFEYPPRSMVPTSQNVWSFVSGQAYGNGLYAAVATSTTSGYDAYKVFTKSTDFWMSAAAPTLASPQEIVVVMPTMVKVAYVAITAGKVLASTPKTLRIQGTMSKSMQASYEDYGTYSSLSWEAGETKVFYVGNSTYCRKFKVSVLETQTTGAFAILSEVQFFGVDDRTQEYPVWPLGANGSQTISGQPYGNLTYEATATLQNSSDFQACMAFQKNAGDYNSKSVWYAGTQTVPQLLRLDIGKAITITSYTIGGAPATADNPKSWELQASYDNYNYVTIDTRVNETFAFIYELKPYALLPVPTTAYRWYQLKINVGGNVGALVCEFSVHGSEELYYGTSPALVFDNTNTGLYADSLVVRGYESKLARLQLALPYPILLSSYTLRASTQPIIWSALTPRDWFIYGTNDGVAWTAVDHRKNVAWASSGTTSNFSMTIPDRAYSTYSIVVYGTSLGVPYYNALIEGWKLTELPAKAAYPPKALTYNTTFLETSTYGLGDYTVSSPVISSTAREYPPSAMSANTQSFVSTAYGQGTYSVQASTISTSPNDAQPFRAFDKGASSSFGWQSGNTSSLLPQWIQIKLPIAVRLNYYTFSMKHDTNTVSSPSSFYLEGSTDGVSWVRLDKQSYVPWSSGNTEVKRFMTSGVTLFYRFYRLTVSAVTLSGSVVRVGQLRLYGDEATQYEYPPAALTSFSNIVDGHGVVFHAALVGCFERGLQGNLPTCKRLQQTNW